MKKSDIKLFTPFVNQNGYLSICYKITKEKMYLFNYNGSFYTLSINDSSVNYKESTINIKDFFINFPKDKLNYESKVVYNAVFSHYELQKQEFSTNKLLLIL